MTWERALPPLKIQTVAAKKYEYLPPEIGDPTGRTGLPTALRT